MFRKLALFLVSSSALVGALPEREPWLSSFLDSSVALEQSHTESSQVDTKHGKKRKFFHSEKTSVIASLVPWPIVSSSVVLDLTRTQKKAYGFDALSVRSEYALLSDLKDDFVSMTVGGVLSFSPIPRICDLSSQNHSPFEAGAHLAVGKEFGYSDSGFSRVAAIGRIGKGNRGAAWAGVDAFIQRNFAESHYLSLFFESEYGLSHHRLSSLEHFRGWATVGYAFGDMGVRYEFYKSWFGVVYSELRMRIFAHDALSKAWGARVGMQLPLAFL